MYVEYWANSTQSTSISYKKFGYRYEDHSRLNSSVSLQISSRIFFCSPRLYVVVTNEYQFFVDDFSSLVIDMQFRFGN